MRKGKYSCKLNNAHFENEIKAIKDFSSIVNCIVYLFDAKLGKIEVTFVKKYSNYG